MDGVFEFANGFADRLDATHIGQRDRAIFLDGFIQWFHRFGQAGEGNGNDVTNVQARNFVLTDHGNKLRRRHHISFFPVAGTACKNKR